MVIAKGTFSQGLSNLNPPWTADSKVISHSSTDYPSVYAVCESGTAEGQSKVPFAVVRHICTQQYTQNELQLLLETPKLYPSSRLNVTS